MELLDTDVLIDIQRDHPPARAWFSSLLTIPSICGFSGMELLQFSRDHRERDASLRFLEEFEIVWPLTYDLSRAANQFASLHLSHGLGLLDSLIAATAVGNDATLFTFNTKHFKSVPDLTLSEPYVR